MQLRRFTADSTPAALHAVRLALGDEAIILANRKIGDQVEIIATGQMDDAQSLADMSLDVPVHDAAANSVVDTPEPRTANLLAGSRYDADHQRKDSDLSGARKSTTIEDLTAAIEDVEQASTPIQLTRPRQAVSAHSKDSVGKPTGSQSTTKSSKLKGKDAKGASQSSEDERSRLSPAPSQSVQHLASSFNETVNQHNERLAEILEAQSAMIDQYFKGLEVNLWGNTAPNRRLHLQKLLSLGLGAELAVQLVERADPKQDVDEALRNSFSLLKSTLPIGSDKSFSKPGVTIFYGAPGAGKTTALIKMAMQHVKENGTDSIVIICADTRRIGAFEELQAYGRLLGVPTVHAHDSLELESLLSAFTHKQLVLVDHTLPSENDAVDLPACLAKDTGSDAVRHLMVLSATSQTSSADALIANNCSERSMQCVLTNLDASARLGELFSAIIRHSLPIAYWSDASSVQSPLQKAEGSILIATAVAMSRRLNQSPDDEWLMRLIQPSDELVAQPVLPTQNNKVFV